MVRRWWDGNWRRPIASLETVSLTLGMTIQ
jgi:hypothetical protein